MMSKVTNIVELIERQAECYPDKVVYQYLKNGDTLEQSLTFEALCRQVKNLAAHIQSSSKPGDRALLLYPSCLDYIVAFFACLSAGVIAVPAYPPKNKRRDWPRLQSILDDSGANLVISLESYRDGVDDWFDGQEAQKPAFIASDNLDQSIALSWQNPQVNGETIAFLQYSSGSTGTPKGVMVSHANLLHNEKVLASSFQGHADVTVVGWLPIYHDMGLIGNVISALYCGSKFILMSPASVVQKPFKWLKAISDYKAEISGGPNFIYDLCTQQISAEQKQQLDLSHWKVAFNGAEPISAATLQRFADAFDVSGFHHSAFLPCYGLAENTLIATAKHMQQAPRLMHVDADELKENRAIEKLKAGDGKLMELVSSGSNIVDQSVRIVNPQTKEACADNSVGEIWVSGDSVAKGYWQNAELTETTFNAFVGDEGPYMRTGDYGFMVDGDLFVTGRMKEVIISNGQNYYPQDIEASVQSVSAIFRKGSGAAFSVSLDDKEQLIVVQELTRQGMRLDADAIDKLVLNTQIAIAEQHQLVLSDLVLVKFGALSKTTSGKIQRYLNRDRYLAEELPILHSSKANQANYVEPETETEKQLCSICKDLLGIDRIGVNDNFFMLGGNSLLAAKFITRLEQEFQIKMPFEELFKAPSLRQLSQTIEQKKPTMTAQMFDQMSDLLDDLEA